MSAAVRIVSVILAAVVPTILTLFATTGVRAADGLPEREPGPRAVGKVYTWNSPDGLAYDFFLPKSYDVENGITLTFILHGSNGWKGWGFGMHAPGEFRPEHFVVSPNGATPRRRTASPRRSSSATTRS